MSSLYPNQVIVSAHLTEKASLVGQFANTYVFKVAGKATKLFTNWVINSSFTGCLKITSETEVLDLEFITGRSIIKPL